jgi:DNA-binding PadR family transcriptional regulator
MSLAAETLWVKSRAETFLVLPARKWFSTLTVVMAVEGGHGDGERVVMKTDRVALREEAPMRSLVNWALLGLVIDRPSYAYELAARFKHNYGDALSLSSVSHVYTAMGALKDRLLVQEIPGTRNGRQPRPHYRATAKGMDAYRDWLVGQIKEDRHRQQLFVVQLGAFMRKPHEALELLKRYEESCLELAGSRTVVRLDAVRGGESAALIDRLLEEETRLALGAKLAWAKYARQRLTALLDDSEHSELVARRA